jgi:ABC-type multidrug transport system ATPase subunit
MELKIDGLSKRYPGGVQALADVSLTIGPGMFGLLGPNGAGKSTLMRILATLQDADAGSVTLDGLDVLHQKEEVRKLLGYLPQEFGLYPRVSAFELLDHLASLKGIAPARRRWEVVHALLRRTNLFEVRHRRLGTFSGGMKQRFGIAQALLGQPKLIIVDEPTAGLDPEERIRFHNLLSDISEQVIVILSTHIVADVSDLCRRMAILHGGRLVAAGDPTELAGALRGRLWRKVVENAALADHQSRFMVVATRRSAGRIVIHVQGDSLPGPGFEPIAPDLEDAYFWAIREAAAAPPPARAAV